MFRSRNFLVNHCLHDCMNTMRAFSILIATLFSASAVHAQLRPDSGSFFVRLGNDTIAIERYQRTPQMLTAEALLRTPVTRHISLNVTFKEDGTLSWWEVINSPVAGVPNSAPKQRVLVTLIGDSAQVELWSGATQRPTRKFAAHARMLPLQIPFYSTYETAIQRARANPADTMLQMLAANSPLSYRIAYGGADTVTLHHPQTGLHVLRVDRAGRLQRFSGEATTFKVVVTRSRPVDLQPYSERFAKADKEGKSVGFLSPRDTAAATIGSAAVTVDYSRPAKRGRVIFGGIVPFNQVWRTGANAATQLTIEGADIEIGGTRVPAGKYTLWTIPAQTGWQLIINKQTGQWGTVYDEKQDLVRIPVKSERVAVPVEAFTIDVPARGAAEGALVLVWDRTKVVVPFRVVE